MKTLYLFVMLACMAPHDWYGVETPPAVAAAKVKQPAVPRVQCVLVCIPGCGPCETMKRNMAMQLVPLGWTLGTESTVDIRLVDASQKETLAKPFRVNAYPTCVILRDGKEVWRKVGVVSMGELTAAINRERTKAKE